MTGKLVFGMLAGLAVLVLLVFVSIWLEKRKNQQEYDERQKQIQGKAAMFALGLGSCWYLGLFMAMQYRMAIPLSAATLLVLGLCLQLLAFHIYCLVRGIGLPLKKTGWTMPSIYAINGCTQFMLFRNDKGYLEAYEAYIKLEPDTTLPDPGDGTMIWIHLILAISLMAMAVIYLIAILREVRE